MHRLRAKVSRGNLSIRCGCGKKQLALLAISPLRSVFLAVLSVPLLLYFIWLHLLTMPEGLEHEYASGVRLYTLSAIIELFIEPLWIIAQQMHSVRFIVS